MVIILDTKIELHNLYELISFKVPIVPKYSRVCVRVRVHTGTES